MPVTVYCPSCSKELNAPDDLVGKTVACPRCSERFPVGDNGGGVTQNLYPPSNNLYPPGFEPPKNDPSRDDQPLSQSPLAAPPPPAESAPSGAARFVGLPPEEESGAAKSKGPPADENSGAAKFMGPPPVEEGGPPRPASAPPRPPETARRPEPPATARVKPPGPKAVPMPPPAPSEAPPESPATGNAPTTPPKRVQRKKQAAQFVTAGATASHVRLGADGQLPQLVLKEGEERERRSEEKQGMNPLILVAVLALSLGASAAMLFIPETSQAESQLKQQARAAIKKEHYLGAGENIKPYQELLREALQAHSRGDYNLEQSKYRQVMNMLRSEGLPPSGLTGRPGTKGVDPPNDYDLEKQLRILLR